MEHILPELLLQIFYLVVHTPDYSYPGFPSRTPIRRLDNDHGSTAEDIQAFRFGIDPHKHPDFPNGIAAHALSTQSPLKLSHVCREWRQLTFAESSLWSRIYVTNGRPGFSQLFKLWLSNSGSQLLSLVFRDSNTASSPDKDGTVVADMFALAALHRQRWLSLKIRIRRFGIPLKKISEAIAPGMEMTNLRTLAFSFNDSLRQSPQVDRFSAVWGRLVKNSPRLEEMQMWHTMDYDLTFLRSIPFSRLTTITLPMVCIRDGSQFVANLAQCACLRTLSISLAGCYLRSAEAHTIAIPSLKNLDVIAVGVSMPNVAMFLQTFHLPSLTDLCIHANCQTPIARGLELKPWDGVKQALDRWNPKLRSLLLRDETASKFEQYFLPLIHHPALQSLVDLRVGGFVGSRFMEAITVDVENPGSSPLRNLEHIHIESAYFGVDQALAARMALSRRSGHSAELRSVTADFLLEEEMNREMAVWNACVDEDGRLGQVDRSFRWIGKGRRILEREFMIRDFSMIQGW